MCDKPSPPQKCVVLCVAQWPMQLLVSVSSVYKNIFEHNGKCHTISDHVRRICLESLEDNKLLVIASLENMINTQCTCTQYDYTLFVHYMTIHYSYTIHQCGRRPCIVGKTGYARHFVLHVRRRLSLNTWWLVKSAYVRGVHRGEGSRCDCT